MEEDGGPETRGSRREGRNSRGKTRAYQHRKDEVCQDRRVEFQHGDISDREGDREASAIPLRIGRFNGTLIEGQFYWEELTRVRVTKRTVYKIDKILNQRDRRGILEYLVRWRGYSKDFDSWIPASSVKERYVQPRS